MLNNSDKAYIELSLNSIDKQIMPLGDRVSMLVKLYIYI